MANQTCKCKYCNAEIKKDEAYNPIPRQYYCSKEHYDARERERLGENGKGNKIKYKPTDGSDRRDFTDKVQSIYVDRYGWDKKRINWKLICSNANNLLKEHEVWTYATLEYILYYMNDILELDLVCAESNYNPLSLLPFYAQEAENYYYENKELEDYIENFDFKENTVFIKKSFSPKRKKNKIDLSTI